MEAAAWAQADAAWAQAIMTVIAILASGGIAVLIPYLDRRASQKREARARLDVQTTRAMSNGLMLIFRYKPEFTNAGIRARVVVTSKGVQMHKGRVALNPARMGDGSYRRYELDGPCIDNETVIGLLPGGQAEPFHGCVFLMGTGEPAWVPKNATLAVTISNAAGDILLDGPIFVSPIEEGPDAHFLEPAQINPPI